MNVLLVDDEPLALEEIHDLLTALLPGQNCRAFTRAGEAMAYAGETRIDLAFLDIHMRVMDGVTMAKQLQKLNPKVNIVFCTGYAEYMPEAIGLYCSDYILKPVTEEKLGRALAHLRYPPEEEPRLSVHCFGFFDVFSGGRPLSFRRKKTKELFAYLIDRRGAGVTAKELCAALWENEADENRCMTYLRQLQFDLRNTLREIHAEEVLLADHRHYALDANAIDCDYYRFLDGDADAIRSFTGEYMTQYSWAEPTCAFLTGKEK